MASSQSIVDCIVEQMSRGHDTRAKKKMFEDYGLYCNDISIGVVCDDHLFLRITNKGKALLPDAEEVPLSSGAKPHVLGAGDVLEYLDRLTDIAARTAAALPPKPKRRSKV